MNHLIPKPQLFTYANDFLWLIAFGIVFLTCCGAAGCLQQKDPTPVTAAHVQHDHDDHESKDSEGLGSFGPSYQSTDRTLKTSNLTQNAEGRSPGGFGTGPGVRIEWMGSTMPRGANPLDVMKLTASRMTHLQQTPEASDNQAKALFALLEAIDALEGSNEVSAPVGPGFTTPPSGN